MVRKGLKLIGLNIKNKLMIKLDQNNCIGCGLCVNLCPECFKFNGEGKVEVKEGCLTDNIQNIIDSCPMQAISEE